MKSEYDRNAEKFLKKWGIRFKAVCLADKCPPFCDGKHIHGHHHRVTLSRNGHRVTFSFWNSLNDATQGKELDAYSVLACSSSDITCPDTFEEFCSEFGYAQDSRKAEQTFKACVAQRDRLERIFDSEEILTELSAIN